MCRLTVIRHTFCAFAIRWRPPTVKTQKMSKPLDGSIARLGRGPRKRVQWVLLQMKIGDGAAGQVRDQLSCRTVEHNAAPSVNHILRLNRDAEEEHRGNRPCESGCQMDQ